MEDKELIQETDNNYNNTVHGIC